MKPLLVALALAVACSSPSPSPSPSPTPPPTTSTSTSAASSPATSPSPAPCSLSGTYRLRFASNGADGWWLRVAVTTDPLAARLLEPAVMPGLEPGPLAVRPAPAGCGLVLEGDDPTLGGHVTVTLALSPDGRAAAGRIVRTRAHDREGDLPIAGVRDVGAPSAPACVVPGDYRVVFDRATTWRNPDAPVDDRDCRAMARLGPAFAVLRVEPFGDDVAISLREDAAPHGEVWPHAGATRVGPCVWRLDLASEDRSLAGDVTFAGERVTARFAARHQIVIEDGEAEELWACAATDAPATLRRLSAGAP